MSRDSIRSKILGKAPKSITIEVEGELIEIRQPTIGHVLQSMDSDMKGGLMVKSVIDHCFVPGTNDKVFEPEDVEALMAIPFGDSWMQITKALDSLMDYDRGTKEAAKN